MKKILKDKYLIKEVTSRELNKIIDLQDLVYESLDDKTYFIKSPRKRFLEIFSCKKNLCIGIYDEKSNKLVGYANLTTSKYASDKYFSNVLPEEKSKTMYFRTIFIHPNNRGNNLQEKVIEYFEEYCRRNNLKNIILTVHPDNKYSKNNFLKKNYNVIATIDENTEHVRNIMFKIVNNK